jgi:hypothetical protein
MSAEGSELFSSNFLSSFYLGKLKNENPECNILVVLNREMFGTVGKTGNFVLLIGNCGKLSAWISYSNCT